MPPLYTDIGSVYAGYPAINSARMVSGLNSDVVLGYINGVENEINGSVAGRYTLPFSNGCPLLATLALREAIFRLCVERGLVHFPPATQGKSPLMVQHEMDQKIIQQIREGKLTLVDNSLQTISPSLTDRGEIWSNTMNQVPTMHEGHPADMVQDPEKIRSIFDERDGRGR